MSDEIDEQKYLEFGLTDGLLRVRLTMTSTLASDTHGPGLVPYTAEVFGTVHALKLGTAWRRCRWNGSGGGVRNGFCETQLRLDRSTYMY